MSQFLIEHLSREDVDNDLEIGTLKSIDEETPTQDYSFNSESFELKQAKAATEQEAINKFFTPQGYIYIHFTQN